MAPDFYSAPIGPTADKAPAGATSQYGSRMIKQDSTYGIRKYRYLYNAHSASRAAGLPCNYDFTTATYPGLTVKQPATANLFQFAGIHAESVNSSSWGWVQTLGYNSDAVLRTYGNASNASLPVASTLGTADQVDYLVYYAAAAGDPVYHAYTVNLESKASAANSTTLSTAKVFIRGLFET